jgi:hypothetical protein
MTATARPQAASTYRRESGADETNQPCRIFPFEMCAVSILFERLSIFRVRRHDALQQRSRAVIREALSEHFTADPSAAQPALTTFSLRPPLGWSGTPWTFECTRVVDRCRQTAGLKKTGTDRLFKK